MEIGNEQQTKMETTQQAQLKSARLNAFIPTNGLKQFKKTIIEKNPTDTFPLSKIRHPGG